uniref:Uncharacterized protein n=1 Tax=Dendroctonus ponderosae TaxID=77166 RepID=A0AAR5PHY8_DENPD
MESEYRSMEDEKSEDSSDSNSSSATVPYLEDRKPVRRRKRFVKSRSKQTVATRLSISNCAMSAKNITDNTGSKTRANVAHDLADKVKLKNLLPKADSLDAKGKRHIAASNLKTVAHSNYVKNPKNYAQTVDDESIGSNTRGAESGISNLPNRPKPVIDHVTSALTISRLAAHSSNTNNVRSDDVVLTETIQLPETASEDSLIETQKIVDSVSTVPANIAILQTKDSSAFQERSNEYPDSNEITVDYCVENELEPVMISGSEDELNMTSSSESADSKDENNSENSNDKVANETTPSNSKVMSIPRVEGYKHVISLDEYRLKRASTSLASIDTRSDSNSPVSDPQSFFEQPGKEKQFNQSRTFSTWALL